MRTSSLSNSRSVRVERALSKPELTLFAAEVVGRESKLGILELALEPGLRHFARVVIVFGPEVRTFLEEALDAIRHFGRNYASKCPRRHGYNPLS